MNRLDVVLQQLQNAGSRLKDSKCEFLVGSVTYLGYQIDANGLHPVNEKIKAIQDAPEPRNVTELKSYLGLLRILLFPIFAKHVIEPGTITSTVTQTG